MPQAVARAVAHGCVDVSRLPPKLRHALCSLLILQTYQKLLFSGSDFGNPHKFQIPAASMPQAVARAVAHSCVDVSRLPPKLRRALCSLLILQMYQKLLFSGSDSRSPHRFQPPATRMPQAVARAVANSCVDVSPLLLKLRHPLPSFVILPMFQNHKFSGSDFGNPRKFQIPGTRIPQAVARAVVHSCVDVSRLQPKLRHALLSLLILQMLQKLLFSGSDFGNLHRFQIPATRMPQAVARAVAHSCVDVSPLPPRLRRQLLSFVMLRMFQTLSFSHSDVGSPQRFQIPATRMPQAVARAVAHSCVDVSRLPPKLLRKTFSFVILRMSQKLIFSGCDFAAPTNSKPLPHTCPKQLRAWARARGRADAHCKTMFLVFHMLTFFDRLLGRCRVRADRLIVLAARASQADGWKTLPRKRIRFFHVGNRGECKYHVNHDC